MTEVATMTAMPQYVVQAEFKFLLSLTNISEIILQGGSRNGEDGSWRLQLATTLTVPLLA